MKESKKLSRNPEVAWRITENDIKLKYPIFHHDLAIPHDPIIKMSVEEVISDIDFWFWKMDETERIIDSSGKIFKIKYKEKVEYILGVIPRKKSLGTFPYYVEQTMKISDIREIMKLGIEENKVCVSVNIDSLKKRIDFTDSIEEILKICSEYF